MYKKQKIAVRDNLADALIKGTIFVINLDHSDC